VEKLERRFQAAETSYQLALLELKVLEEKMNISGVDKNTKVSEIIENGDFKGFEDFNVLAPLSGVIVNKYTEEGELVVSGTSSNIQGTTLCVIGDLSNLIIYCGVNEIDIPKIRIGYPTKISFDGLPNVVFQGKVKRISTLGNFNNRKNVVTFGVEIDILDKDTGLKPAMTCDIDITMAKKEDVLQVPFESVYEDDEKNYVYIKKVKDSENKVVKDSENKVEKDSENKVEKDSEEKKGKNSQEKKGKYFEKQEVKVGLEGMGNIEIIEGVEEGVEISKNVEDVIEEKDEKSNRYHKRRGSGL